MRKDLLDQKRAQLAESVDQDVRASYMLAMQGNTFHPTHLCLGSGRCMFPRDGADKRICAFCLRVEGGNISQEQIDTITKIFVGGH